MWNGYRVARTGQRAAPGTRIRQRLTGFSPGALGQTQPPPIALPPITESPGTLVGRYKLLQQIGEGGMGVVYMAEQERPVRRRVALKIIKPGMDRRK